MSLPKQFGVVPLHSLETSESASVDTSLTASIDASTEPPTPASAGGPTAASTPPSDRLPEPESDPVSALASLPDAEPDIVPTLASEAPLDAFADPLADELSDVPEDAGLLLDPQAAIGPQASAAATRISSHLPLAHSRMHPSACIAEHIPCPPAATVRMASTLGGIGVQLSVPMYPSTNLTGGPRYESDEARHDMAIALGTGRRSSVGHSRPSA